MWGTDPWLLYYDSAGEIIFPNVEGIALTVPAGHYTHCRKQLMQLT